MADTPPNPDPILAGIDRLRDTAKWLIGAYAGVGAILVAGLQLTSLGKVEDDTRVWLAIAGAAAALLAVTLGIGAIARVLAPVSVVDEEDLGANSDMQTLTESDELWLKGMAPDLQTLRTEYAQALTAYQAARAAAVPPSPEADEAKANARATMLALFDPLDRMRKQVLFNKVQNRFKNAKRLLLLSSLVVAAGVIAFAWAANPSDDDQAEAKTESSGPELAQPSPVTLWIDPERKSLDPLRKALGDTCALDQVKALAVGGSPGHPEVITLPQDNCNAVRFTVTSAVGIGLASEAPIPRTSSRPRRARRPRRSDLTIM
jgi:hypothetical protein